MRKARILVFILAFSLMLAACSSKISDAPVMGKINYEVIEVTSGSFQKLNKGNFKKWYEDNYKTGGMYALAKDGVKYILIGAGERKTSGYRIDDLMIIGNEKEIEVKARLYGPGKNEVTSRVITYPHILVSIKDDGRKLSFAGIEIISGNKTLDLKNDSGKFQGVTENGLVRIKISGVPEEMAPKEFKLHDEVKNSIDTLNIKVGDQVLFTYYMDDNNVSIITEIRKL